MKEYKIGRTVYTVICNVHEHIGDIFSKIGDITCKARNYDTAEDLAAEIDDEIYWYEKYINVATEMGQSMEDAIKEKNDEIENTKSEAASIRYYLIEQVNNILATCPDDETDIKLEGLRNAIDAEFNSIT